MERVDTITEVTTKPLASGKNLYLLTDSHGTEFSTTIRELARIGQEAVVSGQYVHLDYAEKQVERNGKTYTNHYLNAIKPIADDSLSASVGQAIQAAQAAQPGNEPDKQPAGLFDDAAPAPAKSISDYERQLLILAQSSLKTAVETVPLLATGESITPAGITQIADYYATWALQWRP